MECHPELRSPWLIAVWPGMGGVAHIAGRYLVDQLGAVEIESLPADGYFDVTSVEVRGGLVAAPGLPRGRLFAWRDPRGRRDLLVFLGDRQPDVQGYAYCRALIDRARRHGARRVLTFAAMASGVHPRAEPRVQVAATTPALLAALRERGADALQDGQIAGLNGVLVAAAADAGIEAACLLGEMPFFASQLPNPKASRAILALFAEVAGLRLQFDELDAQLPSVEEQLVQQLEELQRASRAIAESASRALSEQQTDDDAPLHEDAADDETSLPLEVEARIEDLFDRAAHDRRRSVELKRLLDRHRVFPRYEDRFLDLFRKR